MIRFVAKRVQGGKLTIGLALFPGDLATLLRGKPELTTLSEVGADNPVVESIVVYAFRDMDEFREALINAGVDPKAIMVGPPVHGEQQQFVAPPLKKIGEN